MDKDNLAFIYNWKKKRESRHLRQYGWILTKHSAKWNKLDTESQTLYDLTYMPTLKKKVTWYSKYIITDISGIYIYLSHSFQVSFLSHSTLFRINQAFIHNSVSFFLLGVLVVPSFVNFEWLFCPDILIILGFLHSKLFFLSLSRWWYVCVCVCV